MMIRTYTELQMFDTLEDRFDYLSLGGSIGVSTFGFDRWMNQAFYRSREWRQIRSHVIVRDDGLDLGTDDISIRGAYTIHHMNPISMQDLEEASYNLLDPEFLITCALRTHNAVHYGDKNLLPRPFIERRPGDTKLW